jgi:RNA polymerase sigma-70 factor (ECF subfamily)
MLAEGRADRSLEAEDLTQETFLKAYQAYHRLRPDSNVRAWLYRIATNNAISGIRYQNRRGGTYLDLDSAGEVIPDKGETPEEHALVLELLGSIEGSVKALPPKQQAAFILRYLQDLSYEEIADTLECSGESARANVYQALRTLRAQLVPTGIDQEKSYE